jgi:hypothetical protein
VSSLLIFCGLLYVGFMVFCGSMLICSSLDRIRKALERD